jgi:polyribonucleotide nucleotidyltransferase
MDSYIKKVKLGSRELIFETGKVARQATGAVLVTSGDTQVLATVVVGKPPGEHQDFFPLTVNYLEKTYATGKIPGGFFKREGRPTEKETLTSRLIDRPLTPLFNDDFLYEVQVICTVLSSDKDEDPDTTSLSEDSTVQITCTSYRKSSLNKGVNGLSISLEVKVSFSVGLPSLLKNPPGIFPVA